MYVTRCLSLRCWRPCVLQTDCDEAFSRRSGVSAADAKSDEKMVIGSREESRLHAHYQREECCPPPVCREMPQQMAGGVKVERAMIKLGGSEEERRRRSGSLAGATVRLSFRTRRLCFPSPANRRRRRRAPLSGGPASQSLTLRSSTINALKLYTNR